MDLSELFSVFLALCQNASEVPPGGLGGWEGGLGGLGSSITIMYQRSWFLNVPKQFSAKLTFHEETRKKIFFIPALYFRWRRWLFLWDIFHCHQITFLTSPPQDFLKINLCKVWQNMWNNQSEFEHDMMHFQMHNGPKHQLFQLKLSSLTKMINISSSQKFYRNQPLNVDHTPVSKSRPKSNSDISTVNKHHHHLSTSSIGQTTAHAGVRQMFVEREREITQTINSQKKILSKTNSERSSYCDNYVLTKIEHTFVLVW